MGKVLFAKEETTKMSEAPQELIARSANRRHFVRNLGLASAAAGIAASTKNLSAQSAAITDVDILNFALNLEYLEAEFYTYATTGTPMVNYDVTITGSGAAGATTGGSLVNFTNPSVLRVARDLADNERYHVGLLQNTILLLGGTPIAKPAINLNALGLGFGSEAEFLTVARVFEEIGVTAYGGAAPLITNKTVLGYAARILATEAEHVGYIRSLITGYHIDTAGTMLDSVDILPPPRGYQSFSTNTQAITAIRSPGEVLALAFGGVGLSMGGFFPAGVNGNAALSTAASSFSVTDAATFTLTQVGATSGGMAAFEVSWYAPTATQIEVRIGWPTGPLFSYYSNQGAGQTLPYVTEGMIFYLQDVTYPKNQNQGAQNTIATAIAHLS